MLGGVLRGALTRLRRAWFWARHDRDAERYVVRLAGVRMSLPPRYLDHFVFSDYEPLSRRMLARYLEPGMHVVDVGAHIGWYSVLAGRAIGSTGLVDAVEPWPENVEFLRANIALNDLENVRVHTVAAGTASGKRAFNITEASDSHGFFAHPLAATTQQIDVEVVPLDDLVEAPAELAKIDVEGAELDVLEGMRGLIEASERLSLLVEWNPSCQRSAGRDPLELPGRLRELGFDELTVFDDRAGRVLDLDEASRIASRPDVPDLWYTNIWARRG